MDVKVRGSLREFRGLQQARQGSQTELTASRLQWGAPAPLALSASLPLHTCLWRLICKPMPHTPRLPSHANLSRTLVELKSPWMISSDAR